MLDHPAVGVGCGGIGAQCWGRLGGPARAHLSFPTARPLTGTGAGRAGAGCRGWGRAASAPGPAHSGCVGPGPAALGQGRIRGRGRGRVGYGSGTEGASVYVGSWRCSGRPAAPLPICPTPQALTDGRDELAEVREGEKGLRQLSKEELQGTSDNVDVLPAPVVQVQALICGNGGGGGGGRAENGSKRRSAPLRAFKPWGGDWGRASPWSTL